MCQIYERIPRFRRNVWLFLVANTIIFTGVSIQQLVYNLYLLDIGYRDDFIGVYNFVSIGVVGVVSIPISALTSRIGSRRAMALGVVLMIAGSFGLAYGVSQVAVLVWGAVIGSGQALLLVPSAAFLMENARPEERQPVFSANFATQSVAAVGGSALGGILPGLLVPNAAAGLLAYRATLLVAAAIVVPALPGMLLADDRVAERSEASVVAPAEAGGDARAIRRRLILIGVVGFVLAAGTGMSAAFFNVFFSQFFHAGPAAIGLIFTLGSLAQTVGSLLAPSVGRRIGPVSTVAIGRGSSIALFAAFVAAPSVAAAAVVFIFRYVLVSMTWPLESAFNMELMPPNRRALAAGVRQTSWYAGWGIASVVGGVLIVALGYVPVFLLSGAITSAGAVAYFAIFHRYQGEQRLSPAPAEEPAAAT